MKETSSSDLNDTGTTYHFFLELYIHMRLLLAVFLGGVFGFFALDCFSDVLVSGLLAFDPIDMVPEYIEDDLARCLLLSPLYIFRRNGSKKDSVEYSMLFNKRMRKQS